MIKTLYVNGCSWAAGNGVHEDPKFRNLTPGVAERTINMYDYAWPVFLKEKLSAGILINDATGGGSNARIVRKTIDFVNTVPLEDRNSTLIVLGWTAVDRSEIFIPDLLQEGENWHRFNVSQTFSAYFPESTARARILDKYLELHAREIFHHEAAVETFIKQVFLMKNLLENMGFPFLFFSAIPNLESIHVCPSLVDRVGPTIAQLESRSIMDLRFSAMRYMKEHDLPMSSCIHPLIASHEAWADHLIEQLTNRGIISGEHHA